MELKNACTGNCKIYFPNNDTIYTCPRCGAAIERMPYTKGFEPYYYDISSGSVSAVGEDKKRSVTQGRQKTLRQNHHAILMNRELLTIRET